LKGIFVLLARQGAEAQRINSLAAYFPWGGAKNKLLGGFAASRETKFFLILGICILAKAQRRKVLTFFMCF
jgi:hypothetical protein